MDGFAYHKVVVDMDGKPIDYVFLVVNKAFEELTGLKKEKIIGKRVTEVLKGIQDDPADWIGRYGRVALTGEPAQFENFAKPLGKWYRISAYCPEKGYFVALFEDITEQKKVEESIRLSEQRYHHLFDSMTDMFTAVKLDYFTFEIVHDENGKPVDLVYREVNPAAEKLMGKSREQIIGKSRRELFGDVKDDFPEKFNVVATTGNPVYFESYGAGLQKFYDVYAWKIGEKQVSAIITDITDRKKAGNRPEGKRGKP